MTDSEAVYFTYMWDNISPTLRAKIYLKFRIYKLINIKTEKLIDGLEVVLAFLILVYATMNN